MVVDVGNLADTDDHLARRFEHVQYRLVRWGQRIVAPRLAQTVKVSRRTGEGASDDAGDGVVIRQQFTCALAPPVECLERNHVRMCSDLKHAVRARVDDGLTRLQMRLTQFVQNRRTRSRNVAEMSAPRQRVERVHHHVRKTCKRLKRTLQRHAHKLPVTRRRVLAGRDLDEPAERRHRRLGAGQRRHARNASQTQRGEVWKVCAGFLEGMVERVRAGVAESVGVGERADADGIEHD